MIFLIFFNNKSWRQTAIFSAVQTLVLRTDKTLNIILNTHSGLKASSRTAFSKELK